MDVWGFWKEENERVEERYRLAMDRIGEILRSHTAVFLSVQQSL